MTLSTILVSTWGEGIFAVTGDQHTNDMASRAVRCLTHDGHGGTLAIVDGHSLCRRAPGGEWTTLAVSEFDLSCCMVVRDDIYIGTEDARLLRLSPPDRVPAAMDAFQNTPGRESWYAGSAIVNGQRLGPPLGIRSVAANSDGTVLFANVHVGGIPRSTDGGRTWQPTIDINTDVHEVCAHPTDPDIVIAASGAGLCISRDAGATWTIERDGLHAPYCSAAAFSGEDILVSASTGHFATQGRIYRRPLAQNGGISAVESGMPEWTNGIVDTNCIATNGSRIAVVDFAGTLYLSTDSGFSWSKSSTALPTPSSVLIC